MDRRRLPWSGLADTSTGALAPRTSQAPFARVAAELRVTVTHEWPTVREQDPETRRPRAWPCRRHFAADPTDRQTVRARNTPIRHERESGAAPPARDGAARLAAAN